MNYYLKIPIGTRVHILQDIHPLWYFSLGVLGTFGEVISAHKDEVIQGTHCYTLKLYDGRLLSGVHDEYLEVV